MYFLCSGGEEEALLQILRHQIQAHGHRTDWKIFCGKGDFPDEQKYLGVCKETEINNMGCCQVITKNNN